MAFPAAPTESGSAKIHFLTTDPNAAAGWFAVTEGPTGTGANTVGFAAIATHVEGDAVAAPGGLNTSATDVPLVLVGGDDGTNVGALQVDGSKSLKVVLQAGTAAIGKLAANSGVDIGDVDVLSLPALATGANTIGEVTIGAATTAAGDLAKAEDAIHASGDVGVMALAVRKDVQAALAPDGDYIPLITNASGALYVTGGGGGTEYVVNAVVPADPTGTASLMERDDVLSALAEAAGDWTNMRATAEGALWTQDFNSDAIRTAVEKIDDAIAGSEMQVDVVASLPAGTNAIGKLAANSGIDIGDVDVLSLPSDTFKNEATSLQKGVLVQGDDGTDRHNLQLAAGGDLKVTLDSEAVVLGTGSAAIGKLAANSGVDIGDVDVLSLPSDTFKNEGTSLQKGVLMQGDDGIDRHNLQVNSSGQIIINDGGNSITVDVAAGTNRIGKVEITDGVDDAEVTTGDPGGSDAGLVVRLAGGAKDTGWDAGAIAVQRGTAIGVTATSAQTLLAADASNLYNVLDAVVTIFAGTAAPAGKAYISLKHATTEFARIYAPTAANEVVEIPIHFRMPDRGALNQAVTATLSAALGTNGEYSVNVHAYKSAS